MEPLAGTVEPPATTVVGRELEQEALASFLAAAEGQALVLTGDPGVGKSALLNHVADLAPAWRYRVVRAAGVEAESQLPFAGLHQLLYPLLSFADQLDETHRAAFDVAFGRGGGKPPSVMTLGIAVLSLLAPAASREPVLLVLDDGQWLDTASTEVYGFVGRRLAGSSVKLVVGVRSHVRSGFDTAALPELSVAPLSPDASAHLLDLHHPALDPPTRRLVLSEAQGNPLALLELPSQLQGGTSERSLEESLGYRGVRLPHRIQHAYGVRIEALDTAVRTELLRGALDGVEAGTGVNRTRRTRYRMTDADQALSSGLLDIDPTGGDYLFRHPLVRSTVIQMATPNERRAAHTTLAQVHRNDVERRATHLAAATIDPDEQVAVALEAAADSATRRGGAPVAVAWLTRAAELSESQEERSRRLGDAAFIAGHAGLLDHAKRLVDSATASGTIEFPASVITRAYVALYEDGDVRSSQLQVMAAIVNMRDQGTRESDEVLARLVNLLLIINEYASDHASWQRAHALLASLDDRVPADSLIYQDAYSDVVRRGAGLSDRVERAFVDLHRLEPWDVTHLGVAAYHVDRLSQYRPHLERAVGETARGATTSNMTMLYLLMLDQLAIGEWDEAERTGERSLELALSHGHALYAHHSRAYLALLAALRGQVERARQLQATVDSWARPRGVGFLTQIADAVGTAAALSEGDYEAAYLYAIGITSPGTFESCAHQASRTLLDLVEAAVHTGRTGQARRHALAARDAGLPDVSPRLALTTYGALAMTATDDEEADDMYRRADGHPAGAHFPFELARIRLAHGIRLRHTRNHRAARRPLLQAAETFERLGAPAWSERARAELRASGASAPASSASAASTLAQPLTWQERRIADLAAGGLTNKEIGARLHLSPRTVSSHLYRIFPKLGVTSRAALRDALGTVLDARGA